MEESKGTPLPGQRFCPMDDELVLFYLKPMLSGENVRGKDRVVFDCDLYGKQEPWEIWEDFKTKRPHDLRLNKDIYFFTKHKTMSSTDKRIRRSVGRGTWKGNDSSEGKEIKSIETGRVVGSKKRFSYENKQSVHNGCWILIEFHLDRSLRDKKRKMKDCVLCLLRKNGEPKAKMAMKRKQHVEEEFLEEKRASYYGEMSSGDQQEEFLAPQAKKQRAATSVDIAPETISSSQDDDAFAASLEEMLEGDEDDSTAPSSEAQPVCFQGEENVGEQPLAANNEEDGVFNPPQMEEVCLLEIPEEMCSVEHLLNQTDVGEPNVVNSSTLLDAPTSSMPVVAYYCSTAMPSLSSANGCIGSYGGRNDVVCGGVTTMGYEDGVCMPESSVEVLTDEQPKAGDDDVPDWLRSLDISSEAYNFIGNELQFDCLPHMIDI